MCGVLLELPWALFSWPGQDFNDWVWHSPWVGKLWCGIIHSITKKASKILCGNCQPEIDEEPLNCIYLKKKKFYLDSDGWEELPCHLQNRPNLRKWAYLVWDEPGNWLEDSCPKAGEPLSSDDPRQNFFEAKGQIFFTCDFWQFEKCQFEKIPRILDIEQRIFPVNRRNRPSLLW